MITEILILSGGMGTRLKDAVPDLPKVMAPVAGHPFIYYLINSLKKKGILHFVFLLGYKHEFITSYLDSHFSDLNKTYVIEQEPLGTGGALLNAIQLTNQDNIGLTNGDTFFDIDLPEMELVHSICKSECTLALKPMKNYDRYGSVIIEKDHSISDFIEKKFSNEGLINGGFYIINKNKFKNHFFNERFSFEKDYLENKNIDKEIYGSIQDAYFIDIGIPEDYQRAQIEMKNQ